MSKGATTTRGDVLRVLKDIREQLKESHKRTVLVGKTGQSDSRIVTALDSLGTKLDSIIAAVDQLEGFVDGLEGFVDGLEGSVDGVETKLDTLETTLTNIEDYLLDSNSGQEAAAILDDIRDKLQSTGGSIITAWLQAIANRLDTSNTTLSAIDGNTDGIEGQLSSIEAVLISTPEGNDIADLQEDIKGLLTTIDADTGSADAKLTTIDAVLDNILLEFSDGAGGGDLLGSILDELQSIDQNWNLLSTNQLNLAAILTAVLNNATSGRQDTAQTSFDTMLTDNDLMIADLDDIRIATEDIQSEIKEQHNRDWGYAADFSITAVGGGTSVTFDIQCPSDQGWHNVVVGYRGPVGANNVAIQEIDVSTGVVMKELKAAAALVANTWHFEPENDVTKATEFHGQPWDVKANHAIRILITGVAQNDTMEIRAGGRARTTTVATITTAASTATLSAITTHENNVD